MGSCLEMFMDKGDPESHRLFKVRRTLLQMLDDRGFYVSDTDLNMPLDQFRGIFGNRPARENLRIITQKRSDPSYKISVAFSQKTGKEKLGISDLRYFLSSALPEGIRHAILIVPEKVTSQAKKAVKEISGDFLVEMFEETDLLLNITQHALIPEHEILSEEEKKTLLKKYSVMEHQLPRMLESDPLAKYYGLRRGKVIKLVYSGDVTGDQTTYRYIW
uniref:DNA-directed RNA polymerase IV fifth largest subunit n=1 Tax=Ephedra trifurca TaxID=39583 RepID=A0A0C4W2P0_9SPER|nr:DNA-directed RNA polymerase IV fifth largest subunit [Ephedra trifurca]